MPKNIHFITNMKKNLTLSIVIGIIAVMVLFGFVASGIGYIVFSNEFTSEYSSGALQIANAAEAYISEDALLSYLDDEDVTDDYITSYAHLDNLCNSANVEFIYVIVPDSDYEHITFVFSTINHDSNYQVYTKGYVRETTNEDYKTKYKRLYDGESEQEVVVRDRGVLSTGAHITAMIPLKNSSNEVVGILCVQRQMAGLTSARNKYLLNVALAVAGLIIIATVVYSILLYKAMIKPLKIVVDETRRFASEPSPPDNSLAEVILSDNEIGQLAQSIDLMESETLDYINNLTQVTAEQERIGTELSVAAAIQQSMLNAVSPNRPEFDIFATMTPAKEVGGDFYDYFMIDDDHLCLVMADVSGKGVPAAMFMALSKIMIVDTTLVTSSPSELLKMVNERICKNNQLDMFVTVWIGIVEISTGKVTAANAGHEFPAIYHSNGSFELMKDKHGFVVGGMSGIAYKDYEFRLEKGDSLFLYTDGVPEATNSSSELFGTERMISALNIEPDAEPKQILSNIQQKVDEFVGDFAQFDDLTMMCLKYYGTDDKTKTEESEAE